MGVIASQITSITIVCSSVHSVVDQRKHQSSASLAIVRGIHRRPVTSPHKWPVTQKIFPFDDVIMHASLISRQLTAFGPKASGAVHLVRILPTVMSESAYRALHKPSWGNKIKTKNVHGFVVPFWFACIITSRAKQNGRYFPDDILNCIFLDENVWIFDKISLKFVSKCPINNIPALLQIMA